MAKEELLKKQGEEGIPVIVQEELKWDEENHGL